MLLIIYIPVTRSGMEGEGEEAETPLPPPNRHRRSKDSQIYCRIVGGKMSI